MDGKVAWGVGVGAKVGDPVGVASVSSGRRVGSETRGETGSGDGVMAAVIRSAPPVTGTLHATSHRLNATPIQDTVGHRG